MQTAARRPSPAPRPSAPRLRTKLLSLGGLRVLRVQIAARPDGVSPAQWESVCRVNDAIVTRVRYDHARVRSGSPGPVQSPSETLRRGLGVCSDYAALFEASARRVNLEAISLQSASLNHAWNAVRLGGVWWDVDVTWNAGGSLEGGADLPDVVRRDVDFRRRYLLTTRESEEALRDRGLIRQTHRADDTRYVDYSRTRQAMAIIARIERLLSGADGRPSGDDGVTVAQLYEQYLRLEQAHPLAVSFRLRGEASVRRGIRATTAMTERRRI